jgi:undecaprenyl-diphosphatase
MDWYVFIFTVLASTEAFFLVAGIVAAYLVLHRRFKEATYFVLAAVGLVLSTVGLKTLFAIPRPIDALIEATGYAFPSGHASGSMFLALSLCFMARKLPRRRRHVVYVGLALLALLIGASRIQLAVHTPLQVMAGFSLGAFWALAFIWLVEHSRRKEHSLS